MITISILCHNNSAVTRKCIQSLEKTLPDKGIEVIFTANGCSDDTEEIILKANIPNKVYIPYGVNLGFIKGHNEALKIARGETFIALNNDMIITDKNWPYAFHNALKQNPNLGVVGLQGNPATLKPDGSGSWGRDFEYIDGSCLAGRTDDFNKFGLFSNCLDMFYYEDSDLSLRFRQMGFEISVIPLRYQHARSSTADRIDQSIRQKALSGNGEIFRKKWGSYLRNRMFTNNILMKMVSHGAGDVLCMTPVLEAMRQEHPKAHIEVETNWPDILINNPYINEIHNQRKVYTKAYDRISDLVLDYSSRNLIADEAAKVAGVKVVNKQPQIYLNVAEINMCSQIMETAREKSEVVIAIATQMARSSWAGRNWGLEHTKELINIIEQDLNIACIEIGKGVQSTECATIDLVDQTDLRQLFSVIANSDIFIGIDSLPFHVAQAFKIPSFILFGATDPCARITDFNTTSFIRNEGIPCLGCYQKKRVPNYNKCFLGTEQCMEEITPQEVIMYLTGELDAKANTIDYLQNTIRNKV